LGRPTENGGARCLASKEATSRPAYRPKPCGQRPPAGPQARSGPRPARRQHGRAWQVLLKHDCGNPLRGGLGVRHILPVCDRKAHIDCETAAPRGRSRSCRATKRLAYRHPFRPLGETQLVSGGKKGPVLITSTKIMTPTASPSITPEARF
jgi:hypothetical protein